MSEIDINVHVCEDIMCVGNTLTGKQRADHIYVRLFLSLRYADSQTMRARNIAVGDTHTVKLMYDDVPLTDTTILFSKNKTSCV